MTTGLLAKIFNEAIRELRYFEFTIQRENSTQGLFYQYPTIIQHSTYRNFLFEIAGNHNGLEFTLCKHRS